MGTRGPRPEPDAVKDAKGNPGRRPLGRKPAALPEGGAISARPPRELKGKERLHWARLVPELQRLHLIRSADAPAFMRYCIWLARWYEANDKLREGSLVVTTTSQHTTMDRLDKHLHAALLIDRRLQDLEDRFGMSPSARQGIFARLASTQPTIPGLLPGEQAPAGEESEAADAPAGAVGILGRLN